MNWEWVISLIDTVSAPTRTLLRRYPLRFWHMLLLSGFALPIGIWSFRNTHGSDDAWLAGLCITLVVVLLGTIASASLQGYHLYRDLWVKGALWSMIALFAGFTVLAFLHAG
jgi:hypothetical protein